MTTFKPDNRRFNALICLGMVFIILAYVTSTATSAATRIVWTLFLGFFGIVFLALALLPRYKVQINENSVVINNRLNIFPKTILLNDVSKVKVIDKELPIGLYNNTILHLLLWNKKFNRYKQVQLLDLMGNKLFTIDGQLLENEDFKKLVKELKK